MNAIKISTLVLGMAMASAMGCGSSTSNGGTGGATIGGGTGGAGGLAVADAASGAGGAVAMDAPGAGGSAMDGGGRLDGNTPDVAMGDVPIISPIDATVGEGGVTTLCTGLTPAACDVALRNADTTSFAQTVLVTNPVPDYLTCVAL